MILKCHTATGLVAAHARPGNNSFRCNKAVQPHYNAPKLSKVIHASRSQRQSSTCSGHQHEPIAAATALDRRALLVGLVAAGQLLQLNTSSQAVAETSSIETVFVAGSTGNTGRRVVQQLREAGFKVRAGVRVSCIVGTESQQSGAALGHEAGR
eukprot:GHUV01029809.1.p1 GENE.GHUV01029809.1~~GHUV01029809.1.p1  ORF type:complete len:154 (+),score=27.43 GHUV01029809.1:242-703(+)